MGELLFLSRDKAVKGRPARIDSYCVHKLLLLSPPLLSLSYAGGSESVLRETHFPRRKCQ